MLQTKPLAEIINSGVPVEADEAIAIVQQLIATRDPHFGHIPSGPLSLDNVLIDHDGAATCPAYAATPAVFEVALLLQGMLASEGRTRVPGALRYAIARALHEVDAPPFDSIADFSAALRRHEKDDRRTLVRRLFARAESTVTRPHAVSSRIDADLAQRDAPVRSKPASRPGEFSPAPGASIERRRHVPSVGELRRQLREADEERYRLLAERSTAGRDRVSKMPFADPDVIRPDLSVPLPGQMPLGPISAGSANSLYPAIDRRPTGRWAFGAAAAVVLAFIFGYAVVSRMPRDAGFLAKHVSLPEDRSVHPRDVSSSSELSPSGTSGVPPVFATDVVPTDQGPAGRDDRPSPGSEPFLARVMSKGAGSRFSPAFGSAGTTLFFHTGHLASEPSALETVDLATGEATARAIVDDGARNYHVQPSAAGDRIAYDSDRDGERGVYIANADGSDARRVSGPGYGALPAWSPDGNRLAFVRAERGRPRVWNLWLLILDTSVPQRLTSFTFGQTWKASWFPDGRRIGYAHEDRLFIRNLETGAVQSFASPVKGRLVRTPAVSPTGTQIVFQVARDGVWLLDVAGGSMHRILADPTAEEFAWSPRGDRVAFHSRRDGQWGIWMMKPA